MERASYLPILLTKRGELSALADLTPETKVMLTPLFVVHPIDWDWETGAPSKSPTDHVSGLGKKLAGCWGGGRAFIDPVLVIDEAEPDGGYSHPLSTIVGEAAAEGTQLVPVVSPARGPRYTAAAAALHHDTGAGVCVRLSPRHWPIDPPRSQQLDELLAALQVGPKDADLVLDLGEEVHSELARDLVRSALQALPYADSWRSLTLAGGAFPRDLSEVSKNRITRLPRLDWQLFCEVSAEATRGSFRSPAFGDYAVAHPDPRAALGIDPKMMSISAGLRYTTDDAWLVAKGELYKGTGGRSRGGDAALPVARMIVNADEFCGADFSAGDLWINQVATTGVNGGNPERWRRTATNHHLVFVTTTLSTPHGT